MVARTFTEPSSRHPAQPGAQVSLAPHDGRGSRSLADEHAVLLHEVDLRRRHVLAGLSAGRWPHEELVALMTYLRYELLDQAVAEERLLFPAARNSTTARTVHGLAIDHVRIREVTDRLAELAASAGSPGEPGLLVDLLDGLEELLESHMRTEQSVLSAAPGVESLRRPFRCHLWFPLTEGPEFDVDDLPREYAHRAALDRFSRLRPGETVLVRCRHDLQGLWLALSRAHPDEFGWAYLDEGPAGWTARITRRPPD